MFVAETDGYEKFSRFYSLLLNQLRVFSVSACLNCRM
jgi:hypothetical protein